MKRIVSPCSSWYSSCPSSSQSASLTRTKIPGRTVPSFRNNSGLSARRLSDRNNCQEISGQRGWSDLAPSREAPVSSRPLRWEVYQAGKLCAAFAEMEMLTEDNHGWSYHLVKQQFCPATKLQGHIHLFVLQLHLQCTKRDCRIRQEWIIFFRGFKFYFSAPMWSRMPHKCS